MVVIGNGDGDRHGGRRSGIVVKRCWDTNRSKGGSRHHIRRQNRDRGTAANRIGIKEVVFGVSDLRQADTPSALRYASHQKITKSSN
jgi:hypothetical protein